MIDGLEQRVRGYFENSHKLTAYLATVAREREFSPEVRPVSLMEHYWRFYLASGVDSRKVQEMASHPKAAVLVPFRDKGFSGYLRITGEIKVVTDLEQRRQVATHSGYPIEAHWGSVAAPGLWFAELLPSRVEFMAPGEDLATDITESFRKFPARPA